MAKEVNIVVLCDEIYQGLKAKGCGMSPVEALEKTDLGTDKSFNGTFVNIIFDALEKAKRWGFLETENSIVYLRSKIEKWI